MPFYEDWTFWGAILALAAIVLSQLPPLHVLLKRRALEVEVFNHVLVNHRVGVPHAQLHLIVRNTGGRTLKVTGLELTFEREGHPPFTLPGRGYFVIPSDREAVLLTTFTLQPGSEWGHIVNFFRPPPRAEERQQRQLESNLRADIVNKRALLKDPKVNVAGDDANVRPLVDMARARFPWQPGEYTVTVRVTTEPAARIAAMKYRVVIFESDAEELREYTNGYEYGWGFIFPAVDQPGVVLAISKV